MTKHVHAELMKQYAEDAMETDKPWKRWEYFNGVIHAWVSLTCQPNWHTNHQYRRKQKTININGFEVPEPSRTPLRHGEKYYTPTFVLENKYVAIYWEDITMDLLLLKRGMVHTTKEAAEAHADALLSFTNAVKIK